MLRTRLIAVSALLLLVSTVALAQDTPAPESAAAQEEVAAPAETVTPAEAAAPEAVAPADDITAAPTAELAAPTAAAPTAAAPTAAAPTSPAQEEPVARDGMRIYEVKKGDTLWGISRKFIEDPYYWPDLWANNPEIGNPHFIYPGQKIRIYSGPIMVVTAQPDTSEPSPEPTAAVVESPTPTPATEAAPVAETAVIVTAPAGMGYISADELSGVGEIYDFTDSRELAAAGDTVFIRMKPQMTVRVGDRFEIYKTLDEIRSPVTKRSVGYQVADLGSLEVTALHADVCTAVIRSNFREIDRGAWLAPYRPARSSIALKKATSSLQGHLLSSYAQKIMHGQGDIVFVDLGKNQGLEIGNMLTVTRPRKPTDAVKVPAKIQNKVKLPDELVGYALVIEVKANAATAVMVKALGPALIGDQVQTQIGK